MPEGVVYIFRFTDAGGSLLLERVIGCCCWIVLHCQSWTTRSTQRWNVCSRSRRGPA